MRGYDSSQRRTAPRNTLSLAFRPFALLGMLLLGCRVASAADNKTSSPPPVLPSSVNTTKTNHNPHRFLRNRNRGNVRVLVLLVRFTNHRTRPLPPRIHYQQLCHEQLADYMRLQSYDQYNITGCDVVPWTLTNVNETTFSAGVRGFFQDPIQSATLFTPVLNALNVTQTFGTRWNDYDGNQDGDLDALLIFHSGYPSEGGSGSQCNEPPRSDRVRSQAYWRSPQEQSWSNGVVRLHGYAIASAFDGVCELSRWVQLGVPAHEFLHQFEALDLYDQSSGDEGFTTTTASLGGLGSWDIMSNPIGPGRDPSQPGSLSPWSRVTVGWQNYTEISVDGAYQIRASNRNERSAYRIQAPYPEGEYLVLENRQPLDYDQLLYGNGGILIYHVDERAPLQSLPGFPGQSGWPRNGNHYRVALLQADGAYDLEQGINNGDNGDYWTQGMTLGPSNNRIYPNTDSYQFGQVYSTGINIEIVSPSAMTIVIQVSGLGTNDSPSPTVLETTPPSPVPSKHPTLMPSTLQTDSTETPVSGRTSTPVVGVPPTTTVPSVHDEEPSPVAMPIPTLSPLASPTDSIPTVATAAPNQPTLIERTASPALQFPVSPNSITSTANTLDGIWIASVMVALLFHFHLD